MNSNIRVLVVDDSAFFRKRVTEMLDRTEGVEVIGSAGNGREALQKTHRLRPDVITMDVEMPVMDGISSVKRIMAEIPTPVLMFSSLTREGAKATLDAMEAGAVDFLPKQMETWRERGSATNELGQRVLALGRQARRRRSLPPQTVGEKRSTLRAVRSEKARHCRLIVIGASTGGPAALQKVLTSLPAELSAPLLLVVHMPANFTAAFAERLDRQSRLSVKEAVDGDILRPGHALLAPGGQQMVVERKGENTVIRIRESESGQIYRPSVDVTFGSAARVFPDAVLALVLTGMGADGLKGARALKAGGSEIWSQDEASCVIFGMPRAVEEAGLSDRVLPLDQIGPALSGVT